MMIRFIFLFLLYSCSGSNSPEGVLKEYIRYRFSDEVSRKGLLSRTTGSYQEEIQNMDEESFKDFAKLENKQLSQIKVLHKNCQETTCALTYYLKFKTIGKDKNPEFTSEVKKVAKLQKVDGEWKLNDVSTIKTHHESHVPLTP